MKKLAIILSLISAAMIWTPISLTAEDGLRNYVNPNIGTAHSRWFFYTPAAIPFGMAKLGPSTNGTYGNAQGWEAVGYDDRHHSIDGFPCLHEFQIGGISLMPTYGKLKTKPGSLENPDEGFRSNFKRENELAQPGYYAVELDNYNIKVELTATARVGYQRYTFRHKGINHVIFNIGNREGESGAVKDAYIRKIDQHTIAGYVITEPEYVKKYQAKAVVPMYFYAVTDKAIQSASVFTEGGNPSVGDQINGKGAMMALDYNLEAGDQVTLKIGLSYTSIDNAARNLQVEANNKSFDQARLEATQLWEDALGRIRVQGKNRTDMVKFYTGLYHVLLGRGLASDVNGAYPRNDGSVGYIPLNNQGKPRYNHYNTDALWGAYWNLTTLWALAYPEYYNDLVNSQVLIYKDGGWLGDGVAASRYVSGVGTNMVSITLAGAYNSGIRDFNIEEAYQAARKNELEWKDRVEGAGKMDVNLFVERGYVPFNDSIFFGTHSKGSSFSVSHTMEYCFSAYAVAQWARQLGHQADYEQLIKLSDGWSQLFDHNLRLIRPRLFDGSFIDKFNPLESWRGFQEGNAMQYTFFVPQNPSKLINLVGKERFNHRLDSIFTEARKLVFGGGKKIDAFAGLQSPYNHGNQPSLHIPWLFNFSGKPYLTQKWTRLICNEFYGSDGEHGYGYGQDEDQGQLGAWYVLAAIGLFDVQGGTPDRPTFQIGSPIFDRIEIQLSPMNASGKSFIIETSGNRQENYYIQQASFNGKPLSKNWLFRKEIFNGGTLKLKMSKRPNMKWGTQELPYCAQ